MLGKKVVCPVCGKEFEVTKDTNRMIAGEFICSSDCFCEKSKQMKKTDKNLENK
jgi:uncharacterized protein YbaR (Trm112 family)